MPPVENDEGLGLTLLGVVGKVDVIAEVVLEWSDAGGVDITVIVVGSSARVRLVGVVGKVGVGVEIGLASSDAVVDAIGVVGMDTSMEYTCNMSSSNSFILTQSLTAWTRSGSFSRVG